MAPHSTVTVATPSEIRAEAAEARAGARSCFLAERSALPIDAFRIVAGAGLCLHWLRHLQESAALPRTPLFIVAAALALAVMLGQRPKVCAALLFLCCASLQRALAHSARLDDWIATVTSAWLLLLPIGTTLVPNRFAVDAPCWGARRVPGWAAALFACHVLALHLWVEGFRRMSPQWPNTQEVVLAMSLFPALYLLPLGPLRWLGPICQLSLHGYLGWHDGEWLTHLVLAASALVLFGERREAAPPARPRAVPDAPFALALTWSLLLIAAAQPLDPGTHARALHLLDDLGLVPRVATHTDPARSRSPAGGY